MRYLIFIALSFSLAACGGTANEATSIPQVDRSSTGTEALALDESYIGENALINASLTVNYPTGWQVQGESTQVLLSNQAEDGSNRGYTLLISIVPLASESLPEAKTPTAVIEAARLENIIQIEEVSATTVNEHPAAYATGVVDAGDAIIWVIQFDETSFIVLTAITEQFMTDSERATVNAIAASIRYEVGAIPQNGE